jgi:hypothetical protein
MPESTIKEKTTEGLSDIYVCEVLAEIADMQMFLDADFMCHLTLGQFLALGKTTRERARSYPASS